MNYLNFEVLLLILLFTYSYCHSQERASTFESLVRTVRDSNLQTSKDNIIQKNCSLLFNSFYEVEESIRREHYMSMLSITGSTVHFSDIPPADYCEGRIMIIQIFATEKIVIDQDYDSQGLDVSFAVAAPSLIVIGEDRKIILNGKNGQEHKLQNPENGELNGANGKMGNAGSHGGYFYAIFTSLKWNSDKGVEIKEKYGTHMEDLQLCGTITDEFLKFTFCQNQTSSMANNADNRFSLTFYVNGGNGSAGQNGEHGARGKDGTVFNLSKELIEANGNVKGFETILRKVVEPHQNETYLGNGISEVILGEKSRNGGRGGNGGHGGEGGKPGGVILLHLKMNFTCLPHLYSYANMIHGKKGKDGKNGNAGTGGPAGHPGTDIRLSLYSTQNKTIVLRNIKYYKHESPNTGHNGRNGTVMNEIIKSKYIPTLYHYTAAVFNYKQFLSDHFADKRTGDIQRKIFERVEECNIGFCLECS